MTVQHAEERALALFQVPNGIVIRTWQEQDFLAIQRLSETEGWPTPTKRPEETLAGWHNSWPTLVAIADDTVVGFLRAWSDKHITTYIIELLTDPNWRSHSIGSALLDACHALYPRTRMEVGSSTEQSDHFYQRYGFRNIGYMHRKSFV
jgi:ribosomal protein S18 acetylase RimI-like enzyme